MALEITDLRVIFAEAHSSAPGPEASMLKIRGSEICSASPSCRWKLLGADALAYRRPRRRVPSRATAAYLDLRKLTIYGGSNEIQRNIIAKMILGL